MPDAETYRCVEHIGEHKQASDRNPSKEYTVTFYEDGAVWCSCPAQRYHRNDNITCKHIDRQNESVCGWDQSIHGDSVAGEGDDLHCPYCGGEVAKNR